MLRVATAALTFVLLVAGCGPGEPGAEPSSAPGTGPVRTLTVTVADGKVEPNAERVEVRQGTTVRITVNSDRFDVLHAHGYDKELKVVPGKPTTLEFVADQSGKFEIEFHEVDKLVFQLLVTP